MFHLSDISKYIKRTQILFLCNSANCQQMEEGSCDEYHGIYVEHMHNVYLSAHRPYHLIELLF